MVKKKPLTSNILWDKENGVRLCKFTEGKLETNDSELVKKLRDMGYEVSGEPDDEPKPDEEQKPDGETKGRTRKGK